MSGALNVLLMKGGGRPQTPRNPVSSTNLGFQVVVHLQKEEGWCLHHESEGDLAEKLLQTAYAVVTTENQLTNQCPILWEYWPMNLLPLGPLPTAGCSTPGTFTKLIQAAFW